MIGYHWGRGWGKPMTDDRGPGIDAADDDAAEDRGGDVVATLLLGPKYVPTASRAELRHWKAFCRTARRELVKEDAGEELLAKLDALSWLVAERQAAAAAR